MGGLSPPAGPCYYVVEKGGVVHEAFGHGNIVDGEVIARGGGLACQVYFLRLLVKKEIMMV